MPETTMSLQYCGLKVVQVLSFVAIYTYNFMTNATVAKCNWRVLVSAQERKRNNVRNILRTSFPPFLLSQSVQIKPFYWMTFYGMSSHLKFLSYKWCSLYSNTVKEKQSSEVIKRPKVYLGRIFLWNGTMRILDLLQLATIEEPQHCLEKYAFENFHCHICSLIFK